MSGDASAGPYAVMIGNMVRSFDEVDDSLTEDIEGECKKLGRVLHVQYYLDETRRGEDGDPQVNVAVEFETFAAAQQCARTMNGRLFAARPLQSGVLDREVYLRIKEAR